MYESILHQEIRSSRIELDCTKLANEDGRLPDSVKGYFFGPLHRMFEDDKEINRRTCLYVINFSSPDQSTIEAAYRSYCKEESLRNKSAIRNVVNGQTSTLYVGKVKNQIGGRMVTHLGYGPAKTGGLQLAHWAPAIELQLEVHVCAFDSSLGDFINPIELSVCRALNPLIGKSK